MNLLDHGPIYSSIGIHNCGTLTLSIRGLQVRFSIMILSIMTLCMATFSIILLNVPLIIKTNHYKHLALYGYAECRFADNRYAKCRHAECRYAELH